MELPNPWEMQRENSIEFCKKANMTKPGDGFGISLGLSHRVTRQVPRYAEDMQK